jgi:hypothetical protein
MCAQFGRQLISHVLIPLSCLVSSAFITIPKFQISHYFQGWQSKWFSACGPTHTSVTPLDLVKTRRQVDPKLYTSNFGAWKTIYRAEGLRGVFFGWSPTFVGYSFQGAGKYGFYEVFKYAYGEKMFPGMNKTVVYLGASVSSKQVSTIKSKSADSETRPAPNFWQTSSSVRLRLSRSECRQPCHHLPTQ